MPPLEEKLMRIHSFLTFLVLCFALFFFPLSVNAQKPLVANGSFALDADNDGKPDKWDAAGTSDIEQVLSLDRTADGKPAAKLKCTKFTTGSPASHAMICQTGVVSVKKGQWYLLSWRARAEDMKQSVVQVALSNTAQWSNAGLRHTFPVGRSWKSYEHRFQATQNLPGRNSRLQFWFTSTGTLWLGDVKLVPIEGIEYHYHPQITTTGVTNFIPNSSFECGASGWGSYNPEMRTWAGNVFQLIGSIDTQRPFHGRCSLRIDLAKTSAPVFLWDWFELVDERVLVPIAAHSGWVRVDRKKTYTFSCMLKADAPDSPVRLMVREGERNRYKIFRAGTTWQRFSMTFTPRSGFVWAGVGPDLTDTDINSTTLWIDAVQFEEHASPTAYQPRTGIESCIKTDAAGNMFTDPAEGIGLHVIAYNSTAIDGETRGTLTITDFFDKKVYAEKIALKVNAGGYAEKSLRGILKGETGFFRIKWDPVEKAATSQSLRCMVFTPHDGADSIIGMNHAYGWPFLLRRAKKTGITWARDWSVKWHEVEPVKERFDFSGTDPQINRVLEEGLQLDVMFPFPSCSWSTTADMEAIRKADPTTYRHTVMKYACAPKNTEEFKNYISRCVHHYRGRVRHYQVFNEPVYTHYSLPGRLGYTVNDYIRLLTVAADGIRSQQKDAVIVGGMGIWASSRWTQEFIRENGLALVDILDMHLYPVTAEPESYEPDLVELRQVMKQRGQTRPMWLTEFGCYADDDPYRTPQKVGDAAMSRSLWPSERAAAEALVQSAAVFCSHNIRRIFFHAGTSGPINGPTAGGVFFEYGGTPRKMLAAVSALTRFLDPSCKAIDLGKQPPHMRRYLFKVNKGALAIAWSREPEPVRLSLRKGLRAYDIMGNELKGGTVTLSATPVYLLSNTLTPDKIDVMLKSR